MRKILDRNRWQGQPGQRPPIKQRAKAIQKLTVVLGILALSSANVYADASCDTVKMADPGWSDIDLGQWKLIESSEQAMLAEVSRAVKKHKFVTFLGWTPHPMNVQLKMHYLKGGEKYFGDTASVYTLTRKGYAQACPNVGKLLTNLSFTQQMENAIMAEVANNKVSNADAAKASIKANPQVLDKWLDGVKTVDGKDALAAVKAKL